MLAFTRTYQGEHILVVANLSRFAQAVELDLSPFVDMTPVEIFGRSEFPKVGEAPYFLSLGPHAFYWFTLQYQPATLQSQPQQDLPLIKTNGNWRDIYTRPETRKALEAILPDYLRRCTWFEKGQILQNVQLVDAVPMSLPSASCGSHYASDASAYDLVIVRAEYTDGMPENFVLPLAYIPEVTTDSTPIAVLSGTHSTGILVDALGDRAFLEIPLQAIVCKARYAGTTGEVVTAITEAFPQSWEFCQINAEPIEPHLQRGTYTNGLIVYGAASEGGSSHNRYLFKLFRHVEECFNSDWEVGRFLTNRLDRPEGCTDRLIAPVLGALEYHRKGATPMTLGMLQHYVPEARDAWSYALDNLRDCFERVLVGQLETSSIDLPPALYTKALGTEVPELAYDLLGDLLRAADLLGQRTAELHLTLASSPDDPNFAPEPFTAFYQRSIYQYMRNQAGRVLLQLRKQAKQLPGQSQPAARRILSQWDELLGRFKIVLDQQITVVRTRCHGNFHLEEVLYTGKDFVFIDFEGEPNRSLSERRMKRSPLRDVAGMIQSFYYAAQVSLRYQIETGLVRPEMQPVMQQWVHYFHRWASLVFVKQYLTTADHAPFVPQTTQELQVLLDAYLLEKAVYELGYEMEHRPDWVDVPLQRILELMEGPAIKDWR